MNNTKEELNTKNQELNQCKSELKHFIDELNQKQNEKKQYKQEIIVGGDDRYNVLGEKPTNKAEDGTPIIYLPVALSFDPSLLLSYSVYCVHSVLVMSDGSLKGIGHNNDGRINATLQKTCNDFTDFSIKDSSGHQLAAVSAVCCLRGTLYMFSKSSGIGRQLVLCDSSINEGDPVFLDIGNHHPVSLFGGRYHSAAISSEGEVIFINRNSIKNSPNSPIAAVSLPDGEKASSVACCDDSIVVLSSNGRVFISPIDSSGVLNFSPVLELSDQEIICVSGIAEHFLAVSKEGRVFGCGSNKYGRLGLGAETESVSSQRFRRLKNTKSGQPTLDGVIHFLRHEKVKSFHAVIIILVSSSSAVALVEIFIHQPKRRSVVVHHSVSQDPLSASFLLGVTHHQTRQIYEYINTSDTYCSLVLIFFIIILICI